MDYTSIQATAMRLIGQFGKVVAAQRTFPVQRVNGVESRPDSLAFYVTGVLTSWNPHEPGGSLVQSGDMKFICTAEEPIKIGDILTIAAQKWRIEQPNPIAPDTEAVIVYKAQLRRL